MGSVHLASSPTHVKISSPLLLFKHCMSLYSLKCEMYNYMCMYAYIYIYIHTYMCMYIYIYVLIKFKE